MHRRQRHDHRVGERRAHHRQPERVGRASGQLQTALPNASVSLDGFNLSVSGIPSEVTGLFDGIVQGKVQTALANAIQSKVPGIANAELAGLLANPISDTVLGHQISVAVTPSVASVAADGVYVAVDTTVLVDGGSGGMFLTEPTTSAQPLLAQTPDLGVALANDAVNQLLAGLWAAGGFDQTIQLSSIAVLEGLLDPSATQLALSLSLPPTATTDASGDLDVAIGDAMISVQDASNTELERVALSVQSGLAVAGNVQGALSMTLGTPTVYAQTVVQPTDGSAPLSDTELQGHGERRVEHRRPAGRRQARSRSCRCRASPASSSATRRSTRPSNYVVCDLPIQ